MSYSFLKYSLAKDGDNLAPFEKKLKAQFFSNENQKIVFENAQKSVDPFITFGNVVESMHETFDNSLHLTPNNVNQLNRICIEKLSKKKNLCQQGTVRSRNTFIRANIPTNFLPRASFSLQEESNDHILEFPPRR